MRVTPRIAKNTTQFCLNCWLRKQRPSIESVHKEKPGFFHRLSSKNPRWGHLHKALKPRFLKVPWENPFFFPKEKTKLAFTKRGIHSKRKCAMRNAQSSHTILRLENALTHYSKRTMRKRMVRRRSGTWCKECFFNKFPNKHFELSWNYVFINNSNLCILNWCFDVLIGLSFFLLHYT